MKNILNITNGGCAVAIMEKANIPGTILPWQDVLCEGPVPCDLSLEELSEIRAQYIVTCGWGTFEGVSKDFKNRDDTLKSFADNDKVILWFEHDLYDQLQILQILDWFDSNLDASTELSIICTDKYVGALSPEELIRLQNYEERITDSHLTLASKAWSAFRECSPEKWYSLLGIDMSALPFLKAAVSRMLAEYPDCSNGLSQTARQALTIIAEGEGRPGRVFAASQTLEESVFMGDSSFWIILQGLLDSNPPMLTLPEGKVLTLPSEPNQKLSITPKGREVLSGKRNWLEFVDLDCWIGGVHLGEDTLWCWDSESATLVKKA